MTARLFAGRSGGLSAGGLGAGGISPTALAAFAVMAVGAGLRLFQAVSLAGGGIVRGATIAVAEADWTVRHVLARGHAHGWSAAFGVGQDAFADRPPGLAIATGLVRLATFGTVSTAGAIEALMGLATVAVVATAAWLAKALGLRWAGATVLASLTVGLHLSLTPTSAAPTPSSLLALPVSLALLALLAGAVTAAEESRYRRGATTVATAALMVLHPPTAASVAVIVLVAGFFVRAAHRSPATTRWQPIRPVLLGLALTAPWWLPALAYPSQVGQAVSDAGPLAERIATAASGDAVAAPALAWLAIAGWAAAAVIVARRGRRTDLAAMLGPPAAVVALLLIETAGMGRQGRIGALAAPAVEAAGLLLVVALVPLAAVAARLSERAANVTASAVGVLVVGLAAVAVGMIGSLGLTDQPAPTATQRRVAAGVSIATVPGTRFATTLGDSLVIATLARRPTLAPRRVPMGTGPGVIADRLSRLGVTVLVTEPERAERLVASGRFRPVTLGDVNKAPAPAPAGDPVLVEPVAGDLQPGGATLLSVVDGPVEAALRRHDPENLVIDVLTSVPTRATVAVAWSERWRASIEGRPVKITPSATGTVSLRLPIGESRLVLKYRRGGLDAAGFAIAIAGLLAVTGPVLIDRFRTAIAYARRASSSSSGSRWSNPSRMP